MRRCPRRQDPAAVAVAMLLVSAAAPLSAQEPGDAELLGELGVLALAGPLDAECDGFDGGALIRAYEAVGARRFPRVPRRASLQGLRRHARLRLLPAVRASERALRGIDVRAESALQRSCRGDWMQVFHARAEAFLAVDAHLAPVDAAMAARVQLVPMGPRHAMLHDAGLAVADAWMPARQSFASAVLLAAQERRIGGEVEALLSLVPRIKYRAYHTGVGVEWYDRLESMTFAEPDRPACAELDRLHAEALQETMPELRGPTAVSSPREELAWVEHRLAPFMTSFHAHADRLDSAALSAYVAGCPLRALQRLVRVAEALDDAAGKLADRWPRRDTEREVFDPTVCSNSDDPWDVLRSMGRTFFRRAVELGARHRLYAPPLLRAYEGLDRHGRTQGPVELVGTLRPMRTPGGALRLPARPMGPGR